MPAYLYKCPQCGTQKELFRPIALRDKLPKCMAHKKQREMERLPGAAAVYPQGLRP